MPDYIYHRGARHTIGPDRDEAEATPCLGAQDVYDVLMDRRGGPEWNAAIDSARRICGTCPIMLDCFRQNRSEAWVRAVVTRKSVHAAPGEPKQPSVSPSAQATRDRHAKAAAERLEEVRHILAQGGDVNDVCQGLNLTRSALWKWAQRHAPDAWTALRENELRRAAA